ncbi:WD40-like Beta Propeller Repeat [Cyclobacterium lianum]|uniref:WD40-like Beta Propeller Repeat n=1 Tax=Cyclobacterium lianum TaxID=388280 RepID=A0A1M7Q8Y9_9BACT|nr:OmpA family protein [Cyclobacterium lianum]SHN26979.1 WD40-like Beta Propeller Repeat [Cyclobacterium lianum]
MLRLVLLGLLFSLALVRSQAQEYSIIDKRAIRYFEEGEDFLQRKQFAEATDKFAEAYSRSKDFYEAYIRHAQVLLSSGQASEALEVIQKGQSRLAITKSDYFRGKMGWLEGQIHLKMGAFQQALNTIQNNQPFFTTDFLASEAYREKKRQLELIAQGLENPLQLRKEKLETPLNQFRLQYFPVLTADGQRIFFTKRDGTSPRDHEDIFYSNLEDGQWSSPEPISLMINTRYNEGTCTISADGNLLIFTSCDTPDSFGSCDLYLTAKVNGTWQKPENMGRNVNSRFWDSQPSLSADGSTLFFSSNRPGGEGENDIWYAERQPDGLWSEAKNVGDNVNTSGNEVSPFVFFNNTVLFFSSDGHEGYGGKDIFLSRYGGYRGFGEPENLGFPINDQNDQVALFITAEKDYAYYTENSYSSGRVDSSFLYRFDFPPEIDLGENIIVTEGRVLNEETGEPVDALLSLVDLDNDSTLYRFKAEGEMGEFIMIYPDKAFSGLYVEKEGFMPKIYNVDRDSLKNRKNLEVQLEPIAPGNYFVFENVFFDFDESSLRPSSVSSLNRLVKFLEKHPAVSILIAGHTDNVGSDAYNINLSRKRAEEVKKFLIGSGISLDRIATAGKGSSSPIRPNDTEENRAYNRRIEVVIQ